MKKMKLLICLLCLNVVAFGQERKFEGSENEDKAVVYFVRTPSVGDLLNVRLFEKDKYLGKVSGSNYIRQEFEAGETVFWARAENVDVLKANLVEGGVYVVEFKTVMGAISAGVKFFLVDFSNERQMRRITKIIEKKEGVVFTDQELQKADKKMDKMKIRSMKVVQEKLRSKKKVKLLDNQIPEGLG